MEVKNKNNINKIGNYIHYSWRNYLNYGLGTDEASATESYYTLSQLHQQVKNKFSSNFNSLNFKNGELQTLENQLNFFYNFKNGITTLDYTEEDRAMIEAAMIKIMSDATGLAEDEIDINALIASGGANVLTEKSLRSLKVDDIKNPNVQKNSINAIQKRLTLLKQGFEQAKKRIESGKGDLKSALEFQGAVTNLNNTYRDFINEVNQAGKDGKGYISNKADDQGYNTQRDFIIDLNAAWKKGKGYINTYLQGLMGEIYPVVLTQIFNNAINNNLYDVLESFKSINFKDKDVRSQFGIVGGDVNSAAALRVSNFAVGTLDNIKQTHLNGDFFSGFNGGDFRVYYTQDKVDATINLNGETKIDASIKNVNLSSGYNISLLSGTSLMTILQDYGSLINHWINLSVEHKGVSTGMFKDILSIQVISLMLIEKALAGGVTRITKEGNLLTGNKATAFVVHDNSSGKWRVFDVNTIINTVINKPQYLTFESKNFMPIENTWHGESKNNFTDAYSRISDILADLHAVKFKISMSPQALGEF